MSRDVAGAELNQAAASVLAGIAFDMERARRRRWQERIENAATFEPETI